MLTIFSAFDDRARPKGSRDALGAEAVWSHLGRKVVGNLTTVTWNLDNFMVALLCCHYASQSASASESAEVIQERYLRAEQVSAYLRLAADSPNGVLGVTRAKKNFAEPRIALGASPAAQLLASQAGYGLWGLYSSALEGAGLIEGSHRRLTPRGSSLVASITAQLGVAGWEAYCSLASAAWLDKAALHALAPTFARTLGTPAVRAAVVHALLAQQRDCALQSELFSLAQAYLDQHDVIQSAALCHWILGHAGASADLKTAVARIAAIDPLLSLADTVMLWLQTGHGKSMSTLMQDLQPYLAGLSFDDAWQAEPGLPHRAFLMTLQASATQGNADAVIRAILAQNRALMRARGGAAWIDIDAAGNLAVKVRNDRPQDLTVLQSPDRPWRYSYFLYSFLMITQQGLA